MRFFFFFEFFIFVDWKKKKNKRPSPRPPGSGLLLAAPSTSPRPQSTQQPLRVNAGSVGGRSAGSSMGSTGDRLSRPNLSCPFPLPGPVRRPRCPPLPPLSFLDDYFFSPTESVYTLRLLRSVDATAIIYGKIAARTGSCVSTVEFFFA